MAKKKRKRVKEKKHIVHPLVTTAVVLSLLSVGSFYGTQYVMEYRKDEIDLKTYASGIVQKERFSKEYKDEVIDFDKSYTTDSSNLISGQYTDGKHLKEQLIALEVRCCIIGGKYYTLTGESVMYYSHYVNEDLTKEGVIFPDEANRFVIPNGVNFDECTIISTTLYDEMSQDLVISLKELDDSMSLTLRK